MIKFDERKKSFEKKFQLDEELQFKIEARTNKYLGEWAGLKLKKKENDIKSYIQEIIKADMEEAGKEDVVRKIGRDFKEASLNVEESEIRQEIDKALSRAKNDFKE